MWVVLSVVPAACLIAAVLAVARARRRGAAQPAGKPGGTRRRWGRRWRTAAVLVAATGALMAAGLPSASAAMNPVATSTTLSVPAAASVASPVTVTAVVQPAPTGGSVAFSSIGATMIRLPGACAAAPVVAGVAKCTFTPATPAAVKIVAAYSGAAGFKASASKPASFSVTAAPTATTVTVTGSPVPGSPLTAVATTAPAPDAGTVSFTVTAGSATVAACPGITPSAGTASCSFTPAGAGQYTVTAVYSGDAGYLASTGSGTVTVQQVATTETVSDNAASVAQGDPVVFTAVISAADGTAPAGSVTWSVSSTTSLADSFCASTTYSNGTATCTVNTYLDDFGGTLGGWDDEGHDLTAGDITATAAFTPADPRYAGASVSDSTVKITNIVYTAPSPCGPCTIDTSGSLSLDASQSSLPAAQVEWVWWCSGTGDCSWTNAFTGNYTGINFSSSLAVTFNVESGTIHVNPVACPAGVNQLSGFACATGPEETINYVAAP